jgi:hypothetical protein
MRLIVLSFFFARFSVCAFTLCFSPASAWPDYGANPLGLQCKSPEMTTIFGERSEPSIVLSADNQTTPVLSGQSLRNVSYVRLLFSASASPQDEWQLIAYDKVFHVVAHLTANDFHDRTGSGAETQRWTGLLPGDLTLELVAQRGNARVNLAAMIAFPKASPDTRFFSVKGDVPDWKDLYSTQDDTEERAGAAVGMLVSGMLDPGTGAYSSWCCSGVMVSRDIFLTNWHCGSLPNLSANDFWADDVCANTVIDLAWDDRSASGNQAARQQYSCKHVLMKSRELDFALLRVAPIVGSNGFLGDPIHVDLGRARSAPARSSIFVIHHAQCSPKLVSARCRSGSANGNEFFHDCDTEPGASGSPVFASDGQVVGLHHRGFLRDSTSCGVIDRRNAGIPITKIVEFIQFQNPSLARELDIPPPP